MLKPLILGPVAVVLVLAAAAASAQNKCLNNDAATTIICINNVGVGYPAVPHGEEPKIRLDVHFFNIYQSGNPPDYYQIRFSETSAAEVPNTLTFVGQYKTPKGWEGDWQILQPYVPGTIGPPYLIQVQWCANSPLIPSNCGAWANLNYVPPGTGAPPPPPTAPTPPGSSNKHAASGGNAAPGTCKAGFVWRQVDPQDHVCVTPQTRQQVLNDDAAAPQHTLARGAVRTAAPQGCLSGYVWRQAIAADYVCVTPQTRSATQTDNAASASRTN